VETDRFQRHLTQPVRISFARAGDREDTLRYDLPEITVMITLKSLGRLIKGILYRGCGLTVQVGFGLIDRIAHFSTCCDRIERDIFCFLKCHDTPFSAMSFDKGQNGFAISQIGLFDFIC
jgi:hypothetical protein